MSRSFKPRAKAVGTVACEQIVGDIKKRVRGKERPRYTDDPLLVVAYPVEGLLLCILHVPTGLTVGNPVGFRSVKHAQAAIREIRLLLDWSLPQEELVTAGKAVGKASGVYFDRILADICRKHGGEDWAG